MQLNNPSLPVQKRMSGSRLGYTGCVCVCVCGGGGTAICGPYTYVPLWRVWFSSSLLWDRLYKSERLGLEEGIIFQETDELVEDFI